jgi:PAS domain S-box-containing protein
MRRVAEGVVIVDRHGRFLFFNEAAGRIMGVGPVECPPDEWSTVYGCYLPDGVTLYPPERLPLTRAMRGERVLDEEIFIRNPENPEGSWINVNSSPLLDEKGAVSGGVVVFRDVTTHRRSREMVRQLSKGLETTTDAVFITDVYGIIEYVNPAFESITGYTREEALGRKPSLLKSGHHPASYYDSLWKTILGGAVHSGILVNRRKDGELFHAEQTITPLEDAAGHLSHFVSVMRDITEIKRAQEREVEMRLARAVQQKLYPTRFPRVKGFDMAGAAFPADETCGDYYDFIAVAGRRVGIAVGDVSGHGFGAALLMAETRAYLRSLVKVTTDLDRIMTQLNGFLCRDTLDERFVTLMLVILDPALGSIVYSSAGRVHGYVIDGSGATRRVLEATSVPLGIFNDASFARSPEIALTPGDLLILLTDGAAEAQNDAGEFFGAESVLGAVAEARDLRASRIVRQLRRAIHDFAPGSRQSDDITAVVCKVGDHR